VENPTYPTSWDLEVQAITKKKRRSKKEEDDK
jgi:hypothetical protein